MQVRLLLLAKRQPQQRDLITRPYGRFFHLPRELAARGHQVQVVLVSHRGQPDEDRTIDQVRWRALDLRRHGPIALRRKLVDIAQSSRPEWVIGCSDIYYGLLATDIAPRVGARSAIDAYDNFEGYMPWAKPLHWLWRRALAQADLVTAAGPQLASLLQRFRRREAHVLPMAADPGFAPQDRELARARLELPPDAPLIGHFGSFTTSRGSSVLLDAFDRVHERIPHARLVLTGRYPRELDQRNGVIGLGMVDDPVMPGVIASVNAACVLLADTAFGRYSHPAKLYEAMACGIPVVASATEPTRWILGDATQHLARMGDAGELAEKIAALLDTPRNDYPEQQPWSQTAARLEALLAR